MSNQGGPGGIPGQGQGMNNAPAFDPSLFNANANVNTGSSLPSAVVAALPNATPSSSNMHFQSAQIQQLTEFHRQQQLQQAARTQAPTPGVFAEQVRKHLATLGPAGRDTFLRQIANSDEGKRYLMQQTMSAGGSAASTSGTSLASDSPSHLTLALPSASAPAPGQNISSAGAFTLSTTEKKANIPITQAFNPSLLNTTSLNQSQPQQRPQQTPAANPPHPQLSRPIAPTPSSTFNPGGHPQWSSAQPQYRNPEFRWQPAPAAAPKRKEDGMRGTMRSERESFFPLEKWTGADDQWLG
jgi:hypothetical protein